MWQEHQLLQQSWPPQAPPIATFPTTAISAAATKNCTKATKKPSVVGELSLALKNQVSLFARKVHSRRMFPRGPGVCQLKVGVWVWGDR